MSRRYLSLQFADLPIERMRLAARRRGEPFPKAPLALHAPGAGGPKLTAVNQAARIQGIKPGMGIADARAILPDLQLRAAALEADAKALEALAEWCLRYTPRIALDGSDALLLDITGCAHLFGGEQAMLDDLKEQLRRRGLTIDLAIADRRLAAWVWARFGGGGILAAGEAQQKLEALPVRALRLDTAMAGVFERLGFRHIGQLAALPHSSLLNRFGEGPVLRLEALFGTSGEIFTALRERPRFAARIGWPEPIGRTEDIEAAIDHLLKALCSELERAGLAARRLDLMLFRLDGEVLRLEVGAGAPTRAVNHWRRLFDLRLDNLDIGFGVELMRLEAPDTATVRPEQADLSATVDKAALAGLVDRLATRLGRERVQCLEPVASHIPERAVRGIDAAQPFEPASYLAKQPRPLRLFAEPRPLTALAEIPDGPPLRITHKRRVSKILQAVGPERILGEWWQLDQATMRPRDYFQAIDESGRHLWLFREGLFGEAEPPRWYVHGQFD